MKKLLALLVFSIVGCYAQLSNIQPVKDREVQEGAVEVFYRLGPLPTQTEYLNIRAKVREFIWKTWNERQHGKLKLEPYTKEGNRTLVTFELMVTEGNIRRIDVSIERDYVGRNPKSEFDKQNLKDFKRYSASDIDRVKIPKDGLVKRKTIPNDVTLPATKFLIRLKDKDGKVLSEM